METRSTKKEENNSLKDQNKKLKERNLIETWKKKHTRKNMKKIKKPQDNHKFMTTRILNPNKKKKKKFKCFYHLNRLHWTW